MHLHVYIDILGTVTTHPVVQMHAPQELQVNCTGYGGREGPSFAPHLSLIKLVHIVISPELRVRLRV